MHHRLLTFTACGRAVWDLIEAATKPSSGLAGSRRDEAGAGVGEADVGSDTARVWRAAAAGGTGPVVVAGGGEGGRLSFRSASVPVTATAAAIATVVHRREE